MRNLLQRLKKKKEEVVKEQAKQEKKGQDSGYRV